MVVNIDPEELGKVPQPAVDPEHFLLILWAFVTHSLCCPLFVRFISCLSCSTGLLLCPSFLPVLLFFWFILFFFPLLFCLQSNQPHTDSHSQSLPRNTPFSNAKLLLNVALHYILYIHIINDMLII